MKKLPLGWPRGPDRPPAPTLADGQPAGGPLPLPAVKPDQEEELVERCATTFWAALIEGTGEPAWDELPDRIRERVRAAARAGLVATGVLAPPTA